MNSERSLPPIARLLGYAGLLPQLVAVGLAAAGNEWSYVAIACGFAYAALIFSFLGGVWWGQAVANRVVSWGVYVAAVIPSLVSLALFLPWTFGWPWPGPALIYLGALLALSPLVDRALGYALGDFKRLRIHLSVGLGVLTIILGFIANRIV